MESVFKIFDVGKISKFSEVLVLVFKVGAVSWDLTGATERWTLIAYLLFALLGVSRKQ